MKGYFSSNLPHFSKQILKSKQSLSFEKRKVGRENSQVNTKLSTI